MATVLEFGNIRRSKGFFFLYLFLCKKILGLFEVFDECMKKMMKMRMEEDEEMLKELDVGDASLDTIDLHNLIVPF